MPKGKRLIYDVKTGKEKIVEEDIELPPAKPMPEGVDLEDIKKLIKHAKEKGWI